MSDDDNFCCPSCQIAYTKHLGINGTCAELQEAKKRMHAARLALLRIWPRGEDCEHADAREAFVALGDA